ncbi:MAG TPA: KpsF/GutQ family sugar-phosphate isomerase [Steroidobacteraceae bacterium]|nr:KpsF/GutQ family sugar-phosphate isomerase [Steroidobacteraceae bacterium]
MTALYDAPLHPVAPHTMNDAAESKRLIEMGRDALRIEARAVAALVDRLGSDFEKACRMLLACTGRVVVSGMGKSGHIGGKIAATLASTGTPAFFLHPAEASHGDLGMVTKGDVVLAISYSGETAELLTILPLFKRMDARLVAMTGNPASTLAREADAHLDVSVPAEACPLNLAPTASTTATLAMGDALAVALLKHRGFTEADFARSHPGGVLGRRLLLHVSDVMRRGADLPTVRPETPLTQGLLEMSRKRLGLTAVVDGDGRVVGIFTDGDLRRALDRNLDIHATRMADVMTRGPRSIGPDELAAEAVLMMEKHSINGLLVLDGSGRLVGALNVHDLLRAGVM